MMYEYIPELGELQTSRSNYSHAQFTQKLTPNLAGVETNILMSTEARKLFVCRDLTLKIVVYVYNDFKS